ncbi:MAG: hypothetical protein VX737_05735 [Pseudomonadota bacterium]|nr:hypothetical protein [Pseudomonadota bacterium]
MIRCFSILVVLSFQLLLVVPSMGESFARNPSIVLRRNPHLMVQDIVQNKESNDQKKAENSEKKILITFQAKRNFCLNVRGWMVPTEHFFSHMEEVLISEKWGNKEKDAVRKWLDQGYGYAIARLIEETQPNHLSDFKNILVSEYSKTNAICPFSCSYSDYIELASGLSKDQYATLQKICQPSCFHKKVVPSLYEESFCDCLLTQDKTVCSKLSTSDLRVLMEADSNQAVFYREYKLNSKNNNQKHSGLSAIFDSRHKLLDAIRDLAITK